jgi:hypothetical protein
MYSSPAGKVAILIMAKLAEETVVRGILFDS